MENNCFSQQCNDQLTDSGKYNPALIWAGQRAGHTEFIFHVRSALLHESYT